MSDGFVPASAPIKAVHGNLSQEVIQITEDKLLLILTNHIRDVEARSAWILPLGFLISIVVTFVTADFKKFIFEPSVWQAVFFVFGVICFVWLVRSLWRRSSAPSLENLMEKIKGSDT
ncbi:hypothetical protein [Radicibacter daui]|uniref:hypothetical protein n=1 Tax=Radicibacter daui TaxID=3064829 RepID=UPI004046FC17